MYIGASLIAQLTKNLPAMQETLVQFLIRKIHWRRDRLPTSVFLGFPCGSAGRESICNVGDLQCRRHRFDSWVGKIPWRIERLLSPVFWPGEFHGLYSPWRCKESDTTERFSLFRLYIMCFNLVSVYFSSLFQNRKSFDNGDGTNFGNKNKLYGLCSPTMHIYICKLWSVSNLSVA